jgi:hypothetical protein
MSIVVGDSVEVEVGANVFEDLHFYQKSMIRGAGLGKIFKAMMIFSG